MSTLAPTLFDRRFSDLLEIGRARLRPLAPEWTDHNAHDPGITLMELLAWVAEAQLYSVSRMRRDERAAYAALLGVSVGGTRGALGLIWSDRLDPNSPAATFAKTVVIPQDAIIHVVGDEEPTFRPAHTLLWTPGRVQKLEARGASGQVTDLTSVNTRGGPAFLPFGESAGPRDVLTLTFACRDEAGLFGRDRQAARGARWTIGVLAAPPIGGAAAAAATADPAQTPAAHRRSPLSVSLVTDGTRTPVPIVEDTTQGMLTTGAIVLDLDSIATIASSPESPGSPGEVTLQIRAPRGLPRPPRVLRIEPNVIPILQGRQIERELHVATGLADGIVDLDVPGLRFEHDKDPVKVEVAEATGLSTWRRGRLSENGPNDAVHEFDTATSRITFGNGINGRTPTPVSQVLVSYAVSDGEQGNVGRNRKWSVAGFGGSFGVNLDAVAGGDSPFDFIDQRREARRRSRTEHALVSVTDLVEAAKALPLLEVVRAWVAVPQPGAPRTGVVTLIAMRSRPGDIEPDRPPETSRWLDAIRRQLLPRMPLGSRLAVRAPRYVEFSIRASVETQQGRDPSAIKGEVLKALGRRLTLVPRADGTPVRQPGVPVTRRDVLAWIRSVDGVKRIVSLDLRRADGRSVGDTGIKVPGDGLPRWTPGNSTVDVSRPAAGGAR